MRITPSKKQIRIGTTVSLLTVAVSLVAFSGSTRKSDYIAHEWGTFTSVQGSNGVLLDWCPLETSHLPSFVYDWNKPGLNRSLLNLSKRSLTSRQRMETPVIYFYASEVQNVDVSVQFPQGRITEWYPQASEIGPDWMSFGPAVAKDSRVVWSKVKILPADQHPSIASLIPSDKSRSHYFAARETDAAFVQVSSPSKANPSLEHDKFLFYRGVGDFATPLKVIMASDSKLSLTNQGNEALSGLFVIRLREGKGQCIHLDKLNPADSRAVEFGADYSQSDVLPNLENKMVAALTQAGLYPREATAMVNTWKDSWFAEDGIRVLYVLSREWTDRTLPMQLSPKPQELVRVMVGRAELIPPSVQDILCQSLKDAAEGNAHGREQATAEFKRLGRFAEAALGLVSNTEAKKTGWSVLQAMNKAKAEQVASGLQNAVVKSN